MALKRINMNLSEELLEKVDSYAESMGINRSAAISVLVSTQLQQQDALGTIKTMVEIMGKDSKDVEIQSVTSLQEVRSPIGSDGRTDGRGLGGASRPAGHPD